MATSGHQYSTVDIDPAKIGGIDRYVIVSENKPITEKGSNGSPRYMTYKTMQRARIGLNRARMAYPHATIFDKRANDEQEPQL